MREVLGGGGGGEGVGRGGGGGGGGEGEGGGDLFDPLTIMDPDFARAVGEHNFEFAFNSVNFSDRELRIEIIPEPAETDPHHGGGGGSGEGCNSLADWARNCKRRREGMKKGKGEETVKETVKDAEVHVSSSQLEIEECEVYEENHDEDAVAMTEESPSDIDRDGNDARDNECWTVECSTVPRVKKIYISSAILAAQSPFFYKRKLLLWSY